MPDEANHNPPADDGLKDMSLDGIGDIGSDVTRLSDPPSVPAMPKVPEIELRGVLGRGGMGVVYSGRQPYLNRQVAVKLLKRMGSEVEQIQFQNRFQREAQILAALTHPNIVACYQAGVTESGECYLAMEFIEGPNLQAHLNARGAMTLAHSLLVTRAIAAALAYAQTKGIIHRDVKPENILLQKERPTNTHGDVSFPYVPRLVDLGLARPHAPEDSDGPRLTMEGAIMGTPSTMAPEQINAPDDVDYRADIYGLGCVLYNMLTGRRAFPQRNITEIFVAKSLGNVPDPRDIISEVSPPVAQLCREMLAPEGALRPSYEEIIARCNAIDATPAAAAHGKSAASNVTSAPPPKANWAYIAGAVIVLAVAAAGIYYWAFDAGTAQKIDAAGDNPMAVTAIPSPVPTATPSAVLTPTPAPSPTPLPTPTPTPPPTDFSRVAFTAPTLLVSGFETGLRKFLPPVGSMQWDLDEASTTTLLGAHNPGETSSSGFLKIAELPRSGFELTAEFVEIDPQAGLFVFSETTGVLVMMQDLGGERLLTVRAIPVNSPPEDVLDSKPLVSVSPPRGEKRIRIRVSDSDVQILGTSEDAHLQVSLNTVKSAGLYAGGNRVVISNITLAKRIAQ